MKLLKIVTAIFSLCAFSEANAVLITKVQTFNQTFEADESFHFIAVDLADYGFVAGTDRVRDWVGDSRITFEFRDNGPDPFGSAFLSIYMDQARQYGRVGEEDWEGYAAFNQRGRVIPYVTVSEESAWLGDVTVNFELLRGNVEVPEPLPITLMGLGLFAFGLRRYTHRR